MFMHKTFLSVLTTMLLLAATASCKKETPAYMNAIKITGPNLTLPACAPNYNAVWQNLGAADTVITLSNTAGSLGFTSTTVFPVYMKVNWIYHTPGCGGQITITSYQLQ